MNEKTSFLKRKFAPFEVTTWLVLVLTVLPAAAEITYEITDIGVPAGGVSSHAQSINDLGQVAAFFDTTAAPESFDPTSANQRFGFIWTPAGNISLDSGYTLDGEIGTGLFGGVEGRSAKGSVSAINNAGQVVGDYTTSNNEQHAYMWQNDALTDIGRLGGSNTSALTKQLGWVGVLIILGMLCSLHTKRLTAAAFSFSLMSFSFPTYALEYSFTDLGVLPGGTNSDASAINDARQVTGSANVQNGDNHAFLWENGQMRDLTPGASETTGDAINNSGQVVGPSGSAPHAFIWSNVDGLELNKIEGVNSTVSQSHANGINDSGVVVGNAGFGSSCCQAFIWRNNGQPIQNIGTLGGNSSNAYAINNLGQVVGTAGTGAATHAFYWQSGQEGLVDIGTLGGNSSTAWAINNLRQVVGEADTGAATHAFIWQNGQIRDLSLASPGNSIAYGINDDGLVVGQANSRASLWWNGSLFDLNNYLQSNPLGWVLIRASGINAFGDIVGVATKSNITHGFLAVLTGVNWNADSGAWDTASNWELGFPPGPDMNVDIVSSQGNVTVNGPNEASTVNGLTLGGGTGTATLNLNVGSLTINNNLMVRNNGILNLSAASLSASSIANQGSFNVSGTGTHTIAGNVTNDGIFRVTNTSVQYTRSTAQSPSTFTNNGAYISDPSTNQFNNLSVGSNGYLVGGAGDQFIVTGDFNNASTQNALWNTANADLIFRGLAGTQHSMGLASVDQGITNSIPINSFAWGSITLGSGNSLTLVDGNTTPGAALYTGRIILPDGVNQLNSINSDYNVYFDPTLPGNQYLLGSIRRFGRGNGQLLPWSLVPFPPNIIDPHNNPGFVEALNEACSAPTGILITRCLQLQELSLSQKKAAIASLTPDQVPGQMAGPVKFGATRMDAPFSRLASLRGGGGSAPLSLSFNGMRFPTGKRSSARVANAIGGAAGDDELFRDNPLGFFVQTRFNFGNMQNNTWDRGFDSQARAVTLGADYRINDRLVTGLAFNYTNSSTQYLESAGHMNSDTYLGAFYGSYFLQKDFYVDWVANYGGNQYAFNRQYGFSGFASQSSANPTGRQYSVALSGGKDVSWQAWTMGPYLRLEYLNMHIGEYREQGGNGFDMTTGAQTNHSFVSSLGSQVSYAVSTSWGVITPSVRVEWEHQYLNDNRSIAMRLSQAAPGLGNFIIQTGNPDRDYVNLGGSVSATLPNGGSGFIRYETRLGQSNISDHILEAGLRLSF
ncbi:MAG: autotransporter domain-containing protein [Methylococcaceae bacterium]|nr:autotransporter domain-containing protein [Methylococcaceae bacterium]